MGWPVQIDLRPGGGVSKDVIGGTPTYDLTQGYRVPIAAWTSKRLPVFWDVTVEELIGSEDSIQPIIQEFSLIVPDSISMFNFSFKEIPDGWQRQLSETSGSRDTVSQLVEKTWERISSELLGTRDSVTRQSEITWPRSISNLLGSSSSATTEGNTTWPRSLSELFGVRDSAASEKNTTWPTNTTNNLGATDSTKRLANAFRVFAENFGMAEAFSRLSNASRVFSDVSGFLEVSPIAAVHIASISTQDNFGATDSTKKIANFSKLASDNLGFQDSFQKFVIVTYTKVVLESLGVREQSVLVNVAITYAKLVSDILGVRESTVLVNVLITYARFVSDILGIQEGPIPHTMRWGRLASDNTGIRESSILVNVLVTYAKLVSDLFGVNAVSGTSQTSAFKRIVISLRQLSDNFGLAEQFSADKVKEKSVSDRIGYSTPGLNKQFAQTKKFSGDKVGDQTAVPHYTARWGRLVSNNCGMQTVANLVKVGAHNITITDNLSLLTVGFPSVFSVSPNNGTTTGGTNVTITGIGFTGSTHINFGSVVYTLGVGQGNYIVVNDTTITAITTAQSAGVVDVRVTTPVGISPISSADQFTFFNISGTQWYVDPTGGTTSSDSYDGTSPTWAGGVSTVGPWLTWAKVNLAMQGSTILPGDTVNFADGTWFVSTANGASSASGNTNGIPISFGGTPAGQITFKSTNHLGAIIDGGWVTGSGGFVNSAGAGTRNITCLASYVTIDGFQFQYSHDEGFVFGGANCIVRNCTFKECCARALIPITQAHLVASVLYGTGGGGSIVENCDIYGGGGHCVYVSNNASNFIIRNNYLHDCGGTDVTVNQSGGDALQINGASVGGLFENNRCWNNFSKHIALQTSGMSGITFRNNEFGMDAATALYFVPFTGPSGTMVNCNANDLMTNMTWENNSFSMKDTGPTWGNIKLFNIGNGCTGWTLKNNILKNTHGVNFSMSLNFVGAAVPSGWVSDYNDFFTGQGSVILFVSTNKTFAQWQALGNDAHGQNVDPAYLAATDLHLSGSTPTTVSQGGVNLSAEFTTDLSGALRTVPWSMGCYIP